MHTLYISSCRIRHTAAPGCRPARPITSGIVPKSITPAEWRSTTASGASQGTTSSTSNVMPARPPNAAALYVAITKTTPTCGKNNPRPASQIQSVPPNNTHEDNSATQHTAGNTHERRREVTQSLVRQRALYTRS